ncbi:MAG: serine hydrolase [Bacteroidota bacterium]
MRKTLDFLQKKVPLYVLFLILAVSGVAIAVLSLSKISSQPLQAPAIAIGPHFSMDLIRTNRLKLVRPLVLADVKSESPALSGIKNDVASFINQMKSEGKARDVSVYFRRLNTGDWFAIDGSNVYNPASMVKVAILLTVLKMAENDPKLLERRIFLEAHQEGYAQNISSDPLETGKEYTVRKLLEQMITYSDNDATVLLQGMMDMPTFNQLFSTLKLEMPDFSKEYFIGVTDFSKIFRSLYNATYLNERYSEYALELLTRSTYSDGIVAGIGTRIPVAHKFGERVVGGTAQLHEIGIVFQGEDPYLLGVMTSGSDLRELAGIIKSIAMRVHQNTSRLSAAS